MPVVSLTVPHYKQEQRTSCLAACVRMVLAHFGHSASEDELRQLLNTGSHGARARDILRIAGIGFDVQLQFSSFADLGAALLCDLDVLCRLLYICTLDGQKSLRIFRSSCLRHSPCSDHGSVLCGMTAFTAGLWL